MIFEFKLCVFLYTTGTYIPKKEVEVVETILATIIQPNQAIRLRARKETKVRADVHLRCINNSITEENVFIVGNIWPREHRMSDIRCYSLSF